MWKEYLLIDTSKKFECQVYVQEVINQLFENQIEPEIIILNDIDKIAENVKNLIYFNKNRT